jgi:hypothetical protein
MPRGDASANPAPRIPLPSRHRPVCAGPCSARWCCQSSSKSPVVVDVRLTRTANSRGTFGRPPRRGSREAVIRFDVEKIWAFLRRRSNRLTSDSERSPRPKIAHRMRSVIPLRTNSTYACRGKAYARWSCFPPQSSWRPRLQPRARQPGSPSLEDFGKKSIGGLETVGCSGDDGHWGWHDPQQQSN